MGKITQRAMKLKDGRSVTIRNVRESDAEAYLSLGKAIMSEDLFTLTQADELTFTVQQEKDWIKSYLEDDCHLILVAEVERKIVGQLDFTNGHRRRNAHTGEFGMGVHADYRGLGIGSCLLGALVEWGQAHTQIEKINLCAHQNNERALAMYSKLGFKIEGVRTMDLKYPGGVYVNTVLMGLKV